MYALPKTNQVVIILSVWWVIWAALHEYVLISLGLSIGLATLDSVISTTILGIACAQVTNSLRFYRPQKMRYAYLVFWCLFLALAATWLSQYLLDYFYPPKNKAFLYDSFTLRTGISFLLIGVMMLLGILWFTLEDQKENEKRKTDAERLAREAELFNLRQQLQPHFLFNSLNSINALIGFKPEEARKMIFQLSDFLRGTLHKEDDKEVTLQAELDHLQLYLDIEKVRFGHRLQTEILSDEMSKEAKIPPMLLQPVIENAIKFGLYDTTGQVSITLDARVDGKMLLLTVKKPVRPGNIITQKRHRFWLARDKTPLIFAFRPARFT